MRGSLLEGENCAGGLSISGSGGGLSGVATLMMADDDAEGVRDAQGGGLGVHVAGWRDGESGLDVPVLERSDRPVQAGGNARLRRAAARARDVRGFCGGVAGADG